MKTKKQISDPDSLSVYDAIKQIAGGRAYHPLSLDSIAEITNLPLPAILAALNELNADGRLSLTLGLPDEDPEAAL